MGNLLRIVREWCGALFNRGNRELVEMRGGMRVVSVTSVSPVPVAPAPGGAVDANLMSMTQQARLTKTVTEEPGPGAKDYRATPPPAPPGSVRRPLGSRAY